NEGLYRFDVGIRLHSYQRIGTLLLLRAKHHLRPAERREDIRHRCKRADALGYSGHRHGLTIDLGRVADALDVEVLEVRLVDRNRFWCRQFLDAALDNIPRPQSAAFPVRADEKDGGRSA